MQNPKMNKKNISSLYYPVFKKLAVVYIIIINKLVRFPKFIRYTLLDPQSFRMVKFIKRQYVEKSDKMSIPREQPNQK